MSDQIALVVVLSVACLASYLVAAARWQSIRPVNPWQSDGLLSEEDLVRQVAEGESSRENFMVVVRESIGGNRLEDHFIPTGKIEAVLDGEEVEFEAAWWDYLGDTYIRFVFDQPRIMIDALPDDLERLRIGGIDEALPLALANIERVYGEPAVSPWRDGVLRVEGESPDFNSSYFLDRAFWEALLEEYPEGVVVSVATRGDLLCAPLAIPQAVEALEREAARLYSSNERLRVSSALFLFKDGRWSVFKAAIESSSPTEKRCIISAP